MNRSCVFLWMFCISSFLVTAVSVDVSEGNGEPFTTLQNRLSSGFDAHEKDAAASWDALETEQREKWARPKTGS